MWVTFIYLLYFVPFLSSAKYNRICYFTNWGAHRSMKDARLYPEDVPPDLCTHILYAFANLNGISLQPQLANDINVYQGEQVSCLIDVMKY